MIARPALALPQKGNYDYLVRTDASDFAIGATLRQLQFPDGPSIKPDGSKPDPIERIITYFSRKLHNAETRYSTYDKELLGVRDAIKYWKYYLKSGHKFHVQTDHSALQHILNQPKLTSRQMRLLETLQEYNFDIEYYPGARNYIQDALSRRPDYKKPPIPHLPYTYITPRTTTTQTSQTTVQPQPQIPQHLQQTQQDTELLPILASGV